MRLQVHILSKGNSLYFKFPQFNVEILDSAKTLIKKQGIKKKMMNGQNNKEMSNNEK